MDEGREDGQRPGRWMTVQGGQVPSLVAPRSHPRYSAPSRWHLPALDLRLGAGPDLSALLRLGRRLIIFCSRVEFVGGCSS